MRALKNNSEMDIKITYKQLVVLGIIYHSSCFADDDWHFLGKNIALNKSAHQKPGTYMNPFPFPASLAVDGNNDTDFSAGSCSHTSKGNRNETASLTVLLGSKFSITGIMIFNRKDHMDRLENFEVLGDDVVLYNDNGNSTYNKSTIEVKVDGLRSFSSITVRIPGHEGDPDDGYAYLTLCELQVYASSPACAPIVICPGRHHHAAIYRNSGKIVNCKNTVGTVVEFNCRTGYHMKGSSYIECLSNGHYNSSIPICIPDGDANQDNFDVKRNYKTNVLPDVCATGDEFDNLFIEEKCGDNMSLIGYEVGGRKIQCSYPVKVQNGVYVFKNGSEYNNGTVYYNTVMRVTCNKDYVINGEWEITERRCTFDGKWSNNETAVCTVKKRGYKIFLFITGVTSASALLLFMTSTIVSVSCRKFMSRKAESDEDHYTDLQERQDTDCVDYDLLHNTGVSVSVNQDPMCQTNEVVEGNVHGENDINTVATDEDTEDFPTDFVGDLPNLQVSSSEVYFIPENEQQENCYCNISIEYQNLQSTV